MVASFDVALSLSRSQPTLEYIYYQIEQICAMFLPATAVLRPQLLPFTSGQGMQDLSMVDM